MSSCKIKIRSDRQHGNLLSVLEFCVTHGLLEQLELHSFYRHSDDNVSSQPDLTINLRQPAPNLPAFVAGLRLWHDLGLLAELKMSGWLTLPSEHPDLLTGLDLLCQFRLVADADLRRLAQNSLSQSIAIEAKVVDLSAQLPSQWPQTTAQPPATPEDLLPPVPLRRQAVASTPRLGIGTGAIATFMQSFLAELSVIWLLLLGVFMVIVSSGVLTASQWQRFSSLGQYGILASYTLIFCGTTLWLLKNPALRLTAQALRVTTLLLIPLNFVAMERLGLGASGLEWGVMGGATLAFSRISLWLLTPIDAAADPPPFLRHRWLNFLLLSYAQGIWWMPSLTVFVIYGGVLGTAYFLLTERHHTATPTLAGGAVVYGLSLLLLRAYWGDASTFWQLGLAIALCGALLLEQADRSGVSPSPNLPPPLCWWVGADYWRKGGTGLMAIGWLLTVQAAPWQALVISSIGCFFFCRALERRPRRRVVIGFWLTVLQINWLCGLVIPPEVRQTLRLTGEQVLTATVPVGTWFSLTLLPTTLTMVGLLVYLRRRQQWPLAQIGGAILLGFSLLLSLLSLGNPTLRTLNLGLSSGILAWSERQYWRDSTARPILPRGLRSFIHLYGLLALASGIDRLFPLASLEFWGLILLTLGLLEGVWYEWPPPDRAMPTYQKTAWSFSLALFSLSFLLFAVSQKIETPQGLIAGIGNHSGSWSMAWMLVPSFFTGLALSRRWRQSQRSQPNDRPTHETLISLSIGSLYLVQLLLLSLPNWRLPELAIATLVMLINAALYPRLGVCLTTVGFGLSGAGVGLWDGGLGLAPLRGRGWLLAGAIVILALWLLRWACRRRRGLCWRLYGRACDLWASFWLMLELLALSWHSWLVLSLHQPASGISTTAIGLTVVGMLARYRRKLGDAILYGLALGLELLAVELFSYTGYSQVQLVMVNLMLGLASQWAGDLWQQYTHRPWRSSLHIIPLLFGGLGLALQWNLGNQWTGYPFLVFALTGFGVGRRLPSLTAISYLGVVAVGLGSTELLFSRTSTWQAGDRCVAIAALMSSFMVGYRLFSPILSRYLRLSGSTWLVVAHIHWAIGWLALFLWVYTPRSHWEYGLAIGSLLALYALQQGRSASNPNAQLIWTLLGLAQAHILLMYGVWVSPLAEFLPQWWPSLGLLFTLEALALYFLPWSRWGWPLSPWQTVALFLPGLVCWATFKQANLLSILAATGFYLLVAYESRQFSRTYVSLLIFDSLLLRELLGHNVREPLIYVSLISFSILYGTQLDPVLKLADRRQISHLLRLFATALLSSIALQRHADPGVIPAVLGLGLIFAGLGWRIRAFLYVGTLTFIAIVCYQGVIQVFRFPLLKWAIGLAIGVLFIWIAATFETRREQLRTVVSQWLQELETWQ